jgi:hypothetical protein
VLAVEVTIGSMLLDMLNNPKLPLPCFLVYSFISLLNYPFHMPIELSFYYQRVLEYTSINDGTLFAQKKYCNFINLEKVHGGRGNLAIIYVN